MTRAFSSRDFNQDTAAAKRAAKDGPVFITDRGEAAYVLLTIEAYRRLTGSKTLGDLIGMEDGADIDFDPPRMGDIARGTPVDLDFD
ncbi:type II toxin-antitoxin system Phd/YefM family antitoxin [Phenylobacterium sp.]|uniref:type II toxin-antitoxin system Phd/YefM family antitoxin n=1 Tax=Phenylobacterium sp. TaxID=1871053 RepID=UPI0025DC7722|nr:type II toxin-antitoxin system Phd/YefM family antitoxin [Phenylobacterium sp.]MBX3485501.1 type II toxin-antitoxin system Phd/YefM family antitoxin [Phenylobacterium sp.]MCW5759116.1 type II toxin-antitoxin system Phd/YefM family antitoxin [Phenylobacterium sp.]